ncbi:response regulator [Dyadobacter sp. CY323]|uniref:response regulator n=1 Tax=Dyadobacter sp. CY323 TaxID=2907302 RepID=UPI0038D49CF7
MIILDVNMPRMNELETLTQIRSTALLSMVPVVMYSTSEDLVLIKQAYEIGTSTFVTKPKSFDGLIEMISQITTHFL